MVKQRRKIITAGLAAIPLVCAISLLLFNAAPKVSLAHEVQLRKFPYPYKAMLAFSSDIDGTTPAEFAQYHRFLNTREQTPIGKGLGLDVGDSFWMYMATNDSHPYYVDNKKHTSSEVMTYFRGINTNKTKDSALIKHYWNAGWIDSMHGFGDFSRTNPNDALCKRNLAKIAWEHMKADGIRPEIWINHGNMANRQNFGSYRPIGFSSYQEGDNRKSPFYNTDLDVKNGVHFIWDSVGEEKFGQDSMIFPVTLRDGNRVWGFHRYTFNPDRSGKKQWVWGPASIYMELTPKHLDDLVRKQQYSIVAQHFGGGNHAYPFYGNNIKSLRLLTKYYDTGKILVARTSRLLHYNIAQQYMKYSSANEGGNTKIFITSINDSTLGPHPAKLNDVRGITFYVKDPKKAVIFINNQPVPQQYIQYNAPDETGKPSIGITWFAPNTLDYSKNAPAGY
jgi:hypothetical protein